MTENNCGLRNSESGELVGAQQEGSIPGAGSLSREPGSRDLTTASPPAQMNGGRGGGANSPRVSRMTRSEGSDLKMN